MTTPAGQAVGASTTTGPVPPLAGRRTRNSYLNTSLSQRAFPPATPNSAAANDDNNTIDAGPFSAPVSPSAAAASAGGVPSEDVAAANAVEAAAAMNNAIRRRRNSSGVTIVPIAPEELIRRMRLREAFMNRPRHTLTVRPQVLTSYTFDKRKSFYQKKLFYARVCGCLCRSQKVESDVFVRLPNGRTQRQHQVQRTYNKLLQAAMEQNRNMVKEKLHKSVFNPDMNHDGGQGEDDDEYDDDDDDGDERTIGSSRATVTSSNPNANPLASSRQQRGASNNTNHRDINGSVIVLGNEDRETGRSARGGRGPDRTDHYPRRAAAAATTEQQQAIHLPYTRRSAPATDLSREMRAYYFNQYVRPPANAATSTALSTVGPSGATARGHHPHQQRRESTTYMADVEEAEFLQDYMEDLHTEYFNYVHKEDGHYAYHKCSFFLAHCLKRAFCFRCSLARQTELLLLEYEKRQVIKPYLCCECLFSGRDYKSKNFYYANLYNEKYHFINQTNNYFTRYSASGKGVYSRSTADSSGEDTGTGRDSDADTEDEREADSGGHIEVGHAENQSLVSNSNGHDNGELRRSRDPARGETRSENGGGGGGGGPNAHLRRLLPLQEYDTLYHHSSSYYRRTLFWIMLLDTLSLGICFTPFSGFICYQGIGTALFGWRLRYMVRARYKLHRQAALLDLLFFNMCCPSWCVEQQGVQLLMGGLSEAGPSAALMR